MVCGRLVRTTSVLYFRTLSFKVEAGVNSAEQEGGRVADPHWVLRASCVDPISRRPGPRWPFHGNDRLSGFRSRTSFLTIVGKTKRNS